MADRREAGDMLSTVGFLFSVLREREKDRGQVSYLYELDVAGALLGVFDGGGGDAAFPGLQGRSGGYLAARAACAAYMDRFGGGAAPGPDVPDMKALLQRYLRICKERGAGEDTDPRSLSCSAAVALCRSARAGVDVQLQWVGSARAYLLDEEGLKQLTWDDRGDMDAMEALLSGAAPTRRIRPDGDFPLHTARLSVNRPSLLFTATDGCLAGMAAPMELEDRILRCLVAAPDPGAFETALAASLGAGEAELALSGACLGFESFEGLKHRLAGRARQLRREYIEGLEACEPEEIQLLWTRYRQGYERLICRPEENEEASAT